MHVSLQQAHQVEIAKWDAVAARELVAAGELPYLDFADYVRRTPALAGVDEFLGDVRDKRVLEPGCGLGKLSALLAKSGALVSAFDISPLSVEVTRRRAELNGLDIDAVVAAGEDLPYAEGSFDIVIGQSVLHHLDVDRSARELHRVMAPGGRAVFREPMGMNPILTFVREHIDYHEKEARGADVPLSYREIDAWGSRFSECRYREVQLLAMAERLLGYGTHFRRLYDIDDRLLRRFPSLRRYCRCVVLFLVK